MGNGRKLPCDGRERPFNQALGGLPRGGDAGAVIPMVNRNHSGEKMKDTRTYY